MAASVEIHATSSSSDDSTSEEEDSCSSGGGELDITSWAKIYKSIKTFLGTNQQNSPKAGFIFHMANAAVLRGDFVSALKLYSLGLYHFYKESQLSHQKDGGTAESDRGIKQLPFDKSLLHFTLVECSQNKDKLGSKRRRQSLTKTLDSILEYCDVLSFVDSVLLQDVASLYFSLKEKQKAFHSSARALMLNPRSLSLQEMFENICCHLVERWHFAMLNDRGRNSAYEKAVKSVLLRAGRKVDVCDVGCGTGLLSLIASQQPNTNSVFAIEKSTSMCDVANSVFSANLDPVAAQKIRLINKMSTHMSVPEDMPQRADILVTETFDAGLFGEGILPTLCHAWTYLLKNNGLEKGQVIPAGAQLYMQAVECDAILRESRFVGQFDGLDTSFIQICCSAGLCESDPYAAHDLKHLPGGYRTLSEPVRFMDMDFNEPQELHRLNKGMAAEKLVKVTRGGRLDAIAVWFSLHLGENVTISTHTDSNGCWEQAVFPVHPVKITAQTSSRGPALDLTVQTGDVLKVVYGVVGGRLCLEVQAVRRLSETHIHHNHLISQTDETHIHCNHLVTHSDEANINHNHLVSHSDETYIHHDQPVPQFLRDPFVWWRHSVYCLGSKEVKVLNNSSLHSILYRRLQELLALIKKDNCEIDFIHLNESYSPLCLQALKLDCAQVHKAFLLLHDQNQKALLQVMASQNNVDMSKLTLIKDVGDLLSCGFSEGDVSLAASEFTAVDPGMKDKHSARQFDTRDGHPASSADGLSEPCLSSERSAVVFCDLVDTHGRLVEGLQCQEEAVRCHLSKYATKVVTPHRVDVFGMLVDSEHLLRLSRIQSDNNTLGFNIGGFINKYATRNHQDISLSTLPHTKLTEPFKIFTINVCKLFGLPEQRDTTAEQNIIQEEMLVTSSSSAVVKHPVLFTSTEHHHQTSAFSKHHSGFSSHCKEENIHSMRHSSCSDCNSSAHENQEKISVNCSSNEIGGRLSVNDKADFSLAGVGEIPYSASVSAGPDPEYSSIVELDTPRLNLKEMASSSMDGVECDEIHSTKRKFKYAHVSKDQTNENDRESSAAKRRRPDTAEVDVEKEHISFPNCNLISEEGELTQTVKLKVAVIQPGSVTAMIYWFNLHISPTSSISTLDPAHHWQQAAVMSLPSENQHVAQGDELNLFCQMSGSAISFLIE